MARLNPSEDFWAINFDEKDPAVFNAQIAGAMRIAEKIISVPELYSSEREQLLRIISSVKHASLVKTVEEIGIGNCDEFPFEEYNIYRDAELNEIINNTSKHR